MTAEKSRMSYATTASSAVGARAELHHVIVAVAARELERALLAQSRPPMGMYTHATSAENAANSALMAFGIWASALAPKAGSTRPSACAA